ncbi:MAG: hypothetical protein U0326_21230 [Polyangiales bacterium]
MTGCSSDPATPADVPSASDVTSDTPVATDATSDASDGAAVDPGQAVVARSGCRNCHQSTNAADGVLSGQTDPRPMTTAYGSNLTPDMTGLGDRSEADIVAAILMGVGAGGRVLCPTMPRYRMMSVADATLVARYLRALPPVRRMIPASVCAAADGGADASTDASADR